MSTTRSTQSRQPKGIPVGGQFAALMHPETALALDDWSDDPWGEPTDPATSSEPEAPEPEPTGTVCPKCGGAGTWQMARPRSGQDPTRDCAVCNTTGILPEADLLPVGAQTGLTVPASHVGGYISDPDVGLVVTEHNRDLFGLLTQDDIDQHTELYRDLSSIEMERMKDSITADDITLPADPTPADLTRVATSIDAAFGDLRGTIGGATYPGPQQVLSDVYGTPDRALVALGQAVAARADALAGGYALGGAKETEQWWLDRCAEQEADERAVFTESLDVDKHAANFPNMSREEVAAILGATFVKSPSLVSMEAARDAKTRQALADMAEGYKAALAEIRPMGGTLALHEESSKPGAQVVASTAAVWPSDWVDRSNACEVPLHIGTSINRAHYAHETTAQFKRRGQGTGVVSGLRTRSLGIDETTGLPRSRTQGFNESTHNWTYVSYEPVSADERAAEGLTGDEPAFRYREWERQPASRTDYTVAGEEETPLPHPGKGWEIATDPDIDGGKPFYRRPRMRMNTTGKQTVSQIKLSKDRVSGAPDQDPRFAPAVHEVGHRMEYLVPNLNRMTLSWRERRVDECEDEAGRTLRTIYRGTREVGYGDHFGEKYVGRVYRERTESPFYRRPRGAAAEFVEASEVFSMGSDALFGGRGGGLIGLSRDQGPDEDHKAFILGVFAAAGLSRR